MSTKDVEVFLEVASIMKRLERDELPLLPQNKK